MAKKPITLNPAAAPAWNAAAAAFAASVPKPGGGFMPAPPPALPFSGQISAANAADEKNFAIQNSGPGGWMQQLGNLSFDYNDPHNPFNTQAMLNRAYQQRTRGNVNSFAARGHLYGGSLQNAQNETSFQNQRNTNEALKVYNRNRNSLLGQQALAKQNVANNKLLRSGQQADALAGGSNVLAF